MQIPRYGLYWRASGLWALVPAYRWRLLAGLVLIFAGLPAIHALVEPASIKWLAHGLALVGGLTLGLWKDD